MRCRSCRQRQNESSSTMLILLTVELEDFIKDNNDTVIEIELRDLKELLDNAVLQDDVEYTVSEDPTKMVDVFTVAITRFYSDRVSHKINDFNQKRWRTQRLSSCQSNLVLRP